MPQRTILALLTALTIASPALAGSRIEIMNPWARPSLPDRPGGAYLGIHNTGDAADRLTGARSGRAAAIEIHKSAESGGMMTMTPVEAVQIPAGGMAHLEPGSFHLMLFGIDPPLSEGDTFPMTLIFEAAGEVEVQVEVRNMTGESHQHGQSHQHGTTGN